MAKTFTIDQVSWHIATPGNPETQDHIIRRFYVVACFLQEHGLTLRELVRDVKDIQNDFAICSSDLTQEGLAVMRTSYDKWLQKIDEGLDMNDLSLLKRALNGLRSE
jgi:hypothetical protein